jgi:hypothetical protein
MKKIYLMIFVLILNSILTFSITDIGILEEARPFELRVGGLFNLYLNSITTQWDNENKTFTNALYLFNQDDYSNYKNLASPGVSLTIMHSMMLKNKLEYSYGITLKTPPIYIAQEIYGPMFFIECGLKKNFFSKNVALAYKFGWAFGYNAYPGIDFAMKNSFLFGTNAEVVNFNLILSLLNNLTLGINPHSRYYDIVLACSPVISVVPGIELNWSIAIAEVVSLIFGCTCLYDVNFELYYRKYTQANLAFSINLGLLFADPIEN